jgi:hypothetical protein
LAHLQQQTLEHQVQEAPFLLQLHWKQVLAGQLEEQADQVVHIATALEVLQLVNLEVMDQVDLH